jgi:CMP-N-acetylneuraminic acid synthetase
MSDKSGLDAWRKRVGDVEADRISKFAANRGTVMHYYNEVYLDSNLTGSDRLLHTLKTAALEMEKQGCEIQFACCIYATAPFVTEHNLRLGYQKLIQNNL